MKTSTQPKGLRSQHELYRWFRSIVQTPVSDQPAESATQARFNSAIRAVQKTLRNGWNLQMSGENSPADKAGVDFVWFHRAEGIWFALDTTFKDKVGVPSLINLVKLVNTDDIIGSKLSFESNMGFLELLVRLTKETPVLTFGELPPPEMAAVADPRKSLESFQARLAKIGSRPASAQFAEWATYLNGAICYQSKADTGRFNVDQSLIDYAIGEAVMAFLDARKGGCPDFDRGSFQRGKHISYSQSADTLHVSDPVNPVWSGIRDRVQQAFDKEYAALVKVERSGLELLLITKQMFSAQGASWVIHHILDVIESKAAGLGIQVKPKMKVQESTVLPVSVTRPVRARAANAQLFAQFAEKYRVAAR